MATGICYTQSGDVKRYESTQWEGVKLKSIKVNTSDYTLTGPDSDGNYSITSDGFGVTNVGVPSTILDNTTYWVMTKYGDKPCYFEFLKNQVTKEYDIYCHVDNWDDYENSEDPTYHFFNKIIFSTRGNNNEYNGTLANTELNDLFGYTKINTVSVTGDEDSFNGANNHTVSQKVDIELQYPGSESSGGFFYMDFFIIPKGNKPEDYINYPSIDGEFSNIIYDNNFYKSEQNTDIGKEIVFNDPDNDIKVTVSSRLELYIEFNNDSESSNAFEPGWSSGQINFTVSARNRYSTTIPSLEIKFFINLSN